MSFNMAMCDTDSPLLTRWCHSIWLCVTLTPLYWPGDVIQYGYVWHWLPFIDQVMSFNMAMGDTDCPLLTRWCHSIRLCVTLTPLYWPDDVIQYGYVWHWLPFIDQMMSFNMAMGDVISPLLTRWCHSIWLWVMSSPLYWPGDVIQYGYGWCHLPFIDQVMSLNMAMGDVDSPLLTRWCHLIWLWVTLTPLYWPGDVT